METRVLGSTGIKVSEIGFGAWQLGNAKDWGSMTEQEAVNLVHTALDQGCNFFDTAPGYGGGKSEELLGKAFTGKRDQVVINTKVGKDYSPNQLKTSLETSLKRLQTEYIDTILLHNPPFEFLNGESPIYEELEKLKKEGKIRAYGASVDSSKEMLEVIQKTDSQVLEVLFNIFHQETAAAFPMAQEKGVGIIAKVPLDSGWLSGKYNASSQFEGIRSRWSEEDIQRRFELLNKIEFVTQEDTTLIQAALRFILSYDAISTVIPGIKNEEQLFSNLSASNLKMNYEIKQQLQNFWEKELKGNPVPW
ncbi:aldo/keto reductase [Chengkuizengella axinellae]|uniref:Aldo/keto reductase n=1 Tax=Chengkuizengella axinellae TaxID=3064388 RepID=A0ABT9J455_9BACL|nr:aldo/keto reductase [Chengkuizengella sp. 2205SS18-9]MDP5276402.1 aldo/keto reductase [Chengkuizengella sp. 2205SS18-9]